MKSIILLCLITPSFAILGIGRKQSIAVQGRLVCNGQPAGNIKVKLYEKEPIIDTKLDEQRTNQNGEFRVQGSKSEITNIDPRVNLYHKCNYNGLCYKKIGINIPSNYISSGSTPTKVYDIGTINLANKFNGETIDCVN